MITNPFIRITGMILLAGVVSLALLALVYAIQHPPLLVMLASISGN